MKVNLIGIGSAKCGTTTLFDILNSHIDVCGSRPKEANFFLQEKNFSRGDDWYHRINFPHYVGQKYLLDFTPCYSGSNFAKAAERISRYNPQAKIIYIVRDPFKKLISMWQMHFRSFEMRLPTVHPAHAFAPHGFSEWVGHQWAVGSIKSLYYGSIINEYLKYFPSSSIYITSLESLSSSYQTEVQNLLSFLGLSSRGFDLTDPVKSNVRKNVVGKLAFIAPLIENSMPVKPPFIRNLTYKLRTKWFPRSLNIPEPVLEPHLTSELAKLLNQDYLQCKIDLSRYTSRFARFNDLCSNL